MRIKYIVLACIVLAIIAFATMGTWHKQASVPETSKASQQAVSSKEDEKTLINNQNKKALVVYTMGGMTAKGKWKKTLRPLFFAV